MTKLRIVVVGILGAISTSSFSQAEDLLGNPLIARWADTDGIDVLNILIHRPIPEDGEIHGFGFYVPPQYVGWGPSYPPPPYYFRALILRPDGTGYRVIYDSGVIDPETFAPGVAMFHPQQPRRQGWRSDRPLGSRDQLR